MKLEFLSQEILFPGFQALFRASQSTENYLNLAKNLFLLHWENEKLYMKPLVLNISMFKNVKNAT